MLHPTAAHPHLTTENVYVRVFQCQLYDVHPATWAMRNQRDSFWRLYRHREAGAFVWDKRGEVELEPGRIFLVPAGVSFGATARRPLQQFYVHFDVIGMPHIVAEELFDRIIQLPTVPALELAAGWVAEGLHGGRSVDLASHLRIKSVIYEGLAQYIQSVSAARLARSVALATALEPLLPALRHMENNLAEPISNSALAALCFMSESHFIRRFGASMGQTPNQYLQQQRVKIATQQLLFTDHTIERIAADTGFGSRFYFTRVFTRHTGTAPAAYRKLTWP